MAERRDLTTGPIAATLVVFALPTLGSTILQSLNGSINAVWIGRFLGEDALAATANANMIMFLAFGLVFGFGMAATVLIGQSFGARDIAAARRAFGSAVGLTALGSVAISAVGWVYAPQLLRALSTPGHAQELALAYLRVIFLGLPLSMLAVLIMMGLRGAGDALTPLWFMLVSVVLDAGLNPLLIAGIGPFPALGIAGSAWATLIAGVASLGGVVVYIYARDLPLRLRGAELRWLIPERSLVRLLVAKGLPMGAQMLVMSSAGLFMIALVNREGIATAAAYAVSLQLWTYVQMPAMSLGAAVSAFAAQNVGAGRWDRVTQVARWGVVLSVGSTGLLLALLLIFDRPAMALFVPGDSPAIAIGRHIQLIASWSYLLFGATMILFAAVRANGAVLVPLAILVVGFYPVRLGFVALAYPALGADALWLSFPLGSMTTLALATVYYRYGGWRRGQMAIPPAQGAEHAQADGEPAGRIQPTG